LIADTINLSSRNMAVYEGLLIAATSDANLIALDAKSGKLVWEHATADWTKGQRYAGGPRSSSTARSFRV
jgi:alcohol dehydrogenase (cytochrome c)